MSDPKTIRQRKDLIMSDVMALIEEAKKEGLTPDKYEEYFRKKAEEQKRAEQEDVVRVQAMPHCAIGGFGRFPTVGDMNRKKARELAAQGKVKIIVDDSDIVDEEDFEAIDLHTEEMMAIRKSSDRKKVGKGGEPLEANYTQSELAESEDDEEASAPKYRKPGRPSRRSRRE
jgi:hypothetical protein